MPIDPNFPIALIPVLEKELGIHLDEVRLPKTGMWKSTFLMSSDDMQFVVRLEPAPALKLQRATGAQKRAVDQGVPVPRLLAKGFLEGETSFFWTAEEFVEGEFYYPSIMDTPIALAASRNLGAMLRLIHQTAVDGYGDLDSDCRTAVLPQWGNWIEQRRDEFAVASGLADLASVKCEVEKAICYLRDFPPDHSVLCHGDYADDNVLLTPEGKVTAVIDWNNCLACEPAYDLAYSFMWHQRMDCLVELIHGYAPENPESFWLRIRAHRILLLVYFIVWCHERNSPDGVASFAKTLEGLCGPEREMLWSEVMPVR